jgi:hypothetical protein
MQTPTETKLMSSMTRFVINEEVPSGERKAGFVCEMVDRSHSSDGGPVAIAWFMDKAEANSVASLLNSVQDAALANEQELINPASQVFFRAGLIACREYMARFVEAQDPTTANSIRQNWWPSLGEDFGPPRKLDFAELTEGEYGTPGFRCKGAGELSPTLEALPIALAFLNEPGERK